MSADYILVPYSWRLAVNVSRIGIATGALIVEAFSPTPSSFLVRLLLIVFVLWSVIASSWRTLHRVRFAGFSLVIDSIYFLLVAAIPSPHTPALVVIWFVYLVSSTLLIHPWREVAAVSVLTPLLFVLVRPSEVSRTLPVLAAVGAVGLVAARNRQLLINRLIETSQRAVWHRAQAQQARESERERIAEDFHDGPQQSFISLHMRLEVLRRLLERDPEKAKQELEQLQELTRGQVEEVRAFVRAMRPVEDGSGDLAAAVSRLTDNFERTSGIPTTFQGAEIEVENRDVASELLQIAREALHNAQKHSRASNVSVGLVKAGGAIELSVKDDGAGFPFDGVYSLEELDILQAGPASIKRRVRSLGGQLTVASHPGNGAKISVRIPA